MGRRTAHIILSFCLLFFATDIFAQTGFYVPKKGKIFFKGDTATVFSDVVNEGKLGIGKKAIVNFKGSKWTNTIDAEIAADTTNGLAEGGWVRFNGATLQELDGGFNAAGKSGAFFHNLQLNNPMGLALRGSSSKISREVDLKSGLFYLNDQMLTVGHNNPGTITGYDSNRYFVTTPVAGLLIREGITTNNGLVVFPVGSKGNSYTPAAIRSYSELPDDFYVSVFDSVRSGVTIGTLMMSESVGKTWQIGRRFSPDNNDVEIALQHVTGDEGRFFAANKSKAYVSRYTNGRWDVANPQTHPGVGYLTTSAPLVSSGVNNRIFPTLTGSSYFTKLTGAGDTTHTRLWFNAYRLNPSNVKVYWTTKPEINVNYFVVQRRLANEAVFKNIDTTSSKALNGYSQQSLYYEMTDPNGYKGISFYRLLSVTYGNDSTYSQIVAVGNNAGEFNVDLWPNPTTGLFYISLNTPQPVKQIIIWNEIGQKVLVQETKGQRVVQVDAFKLPQAHYFVSLISELNTIIETKKLIIVR